MQFHFSMKHPALEAESVGAWYGVEDDSHKMAAAIIRSNPEEAKVLLEAHRLYRSWSANAATDDGLQQRGVPDEILQMLVSVTKVVANLDGNIEESLEKYPGLEDRNYEARDISVAQVFFEPNADLENPSLDIFPRFKYVGGIFDIPIVMSTEQLATEEADRMAWYAIESNLWVMVAGAPYQLFYPEGSMVFTRETSDIPPGS